MQQRTDLAWLVWSSPLLQVTPVRLPSLRPTPAQLAVLTVLSDSSFCFCSARFVDPALGFALGWNYLVSRFSPSLVRSRPDRPSADPLPSAASQFKYLVVTPNNIVAAVVTIDFWAEKRVSPGSTLITEQGH